MLHGDTHLRACDHDGRSVRTRCGAGQAAASGWIAALVLPFLCGALTRAQAPTPEQVYDDARTGMIAEADLCRFDGSCGQSSAAPPPRLLVDPCFIKMNALIPCNLREQQASKPVGVDSNIVGIWELPFKGGPWVWEIARDGSYKFHSEAGDGAASHSGTVYASNGHWSLKATSGYVDSGLYVFQAPDIWIMTGKHGVAAWRHPPLVRNTVSPCTSGQRQVSNSLGIDPNIVGVWDLPLKAGAWVMEIGGDGTYKFHSEGREATPSNTGHFSANNGLWSLNATSGYADAGFYLFQAPDIWIVTGKLGTAAWRHRTAATSCNAAP
jgi:hypothetical protein